MLHVVDCSGSIDASGKITEPGSGDPVSDFADIEEELVMWYQKILEGNRDKLSKNIRDGTDQVDALTELYQGIGVKKSHVIQALKLLDLRILHLMNLKWAKPKNLQKFYVRYQNLP